MHHRVARSMNLENVERLQKAMRRSRVHGDHLRSVRSLAMAILLEKVIPRPKGDMEFRYFVVTDLRLGTGTSRKVDRS